MLPHAPGVQMQAIPEDAVHEDSGDEDGEDPDKRISSKEESSIRKFSVKSKRWGGQILQFIVYTFIGRPSLYFKNSALP